eukprot:PhM_4_TR15886/c3_g2_i1/m.17037
MTSPTIITRSQQKKQKWAEGAKTCAGRLMFGHAGYLVTLTSKQEEDAVSKIFLDNTWIGASDMGSQTVWTWRDGPDKGKNLADPNYNNWGENQPQDNNEHYAGFHESKSWHDFEDIDLSVVCEYGGTPSEDARGHTFRGATQLTVRVSDCDYEERASWAHPGSCHASRVATTPSKTVRRNLFPEKAVLDLVPPDDTSATVYGLRVRVRPDMCAPLTHIDAIDGTTLSTLPLYVNTAKNLYVRMQADMNKYTTLIRGIAMTSCARQYPTVDEYNFLWDLELVSTDACTFNDKVTGEPHFYWASSWAHQEKREWTAAQQDCASRNMMGLLGYLTAVTTSEENDVVTSPKCVDKATSVGWGAAVGVSAFGWQWHDGPEAGQSIFASAWAISWCGTDDARVATSYDQALGASFRSGSGCTSGWQPQARSTLDNYMCEFGGTEARYAFRGALNVKVTTSPCDYNERSDYAFPGVCHHLYATQKYGASSPHNVLAVDVVPDLKLSESLQVKEFRLSVSP